MAKRRSPRRLLDIYTVFMLLNRAGGNTNSSASVIQLNAFNSECVKSLNLFSIPINDFFYERELFYSNTHIRDTV